jgi:uncharacterized protein
MKVLLTGATGLIGRALTARLLATGCRVLAVTRDTDRARQLLAGDVEILAGDITGPGRWAFALAGCDGVVHLAGRSIMARRWDEAFRNSVRASRIDAATTLVKACAAQEKPPGVFISASATGYYGAAPEGMVTEDSPPGRDFLAQVCRDWEAAAQTGEQYGMCVTCLRLGVVLTREAQIIRQLAPVFRLGLGGFAGTGQQPFPWVAVEDVVQVIMAQLTGACRLVGPVNVVAPEQVTNRQFSQTLAAVLHRPCLFRVPARVLKLMLGDMAELVLHGQCAAPVRLLDAGYQFQQPRLKEALQSMLGKP